jgi:outer membrane protein assembly factor BamB
VKRPVPALVGVAVVLVAMSVAADDWPEWLGPTRDGVSAERGWLKDWPDTGPPRLFERAIGDGYSAVAVARGRLILFHRVGEEERVESLDPWTGQSTWKSSYPTDYEDRYGYGGGPRSSPLIEPAAGRVYTLGAQGVLAALELATGKPLWKHEIEKEHRLEQNFFGVGAAPIVWKDLIIVNLGGTHRSAFTGGRNASPGSSSLVETGFTIAYKKEGGELAWKSPTDGGSYSTPRAAEIDGAPQLFVFHRGGMTCFDPRDGKERWKFPWMSRTYESVNAATPVIQGDVLFFSAAYKTGSVALKVKRDGYQLLWKDDLQAPEKVLETHWSTAICVDGFLYGFSGRHEEEALLSCVELLTGKVRWREETPLGRGSLLHSDGHFLALGEHGDLALLKLSPEGYKELRRVKGLLRYPAWTPPVLSGGLLYLRDERKLICLDLRPGK